MRAPRARVILAGAVGGCGLMLTVAAGIALFGSIGNHIAATYGTGWAVTYGLAVIGFAAGGGIAGLVDFQP